MGEPSVLPEDEGVPSDLDRDTPADLAALRALIVGPEQRQLRSIHTRLDDRLARAEDLAEVLPQVLQQHAHDPHLARALTPPLEKAITQSVQRNPKPLADALFPVMGPAIRKAVSAGLAGMVESLNRTLEHSLSWKSLQWRLEARRTGRSFGEVVLLKTLVYRVEQVFLIERRTGLLLQHVHAGGENVQDADMVSGMLTAIRDFAQDSFKLGATESLEALKIGDLSVWIEAGPHAIIAAVIRGSAPREYRQTLVDAIETMHLQFGDAFDAFAGDATPFADARPTLEACLGMQYRAEERKPRTRGAWLLAGVAIAALLVWAGFRYRDHARWMDYLARVRSEPGLVVVSTAREDGRFVVSGLRDPLAPDPRTFLAAASLTDDDVVGHWAAYHALDEPLVLARAATVLTPPAGATLTIDQGVLAATGGPPLTWVIEARRLAPLVSGVVRFDAAATLAPSLARQVAAIESRLVLFVKGAADPAADTREATDLIADDLRALNAMAEVAGVRYRVSVVGHTDADGPDEANVPLSLARAEVVAASIDANTLPALEIVTSGVGSTMPVVSGQTEDDNQRNRRVELRVTPIGIR
jgi:outer membrane protein OmpA-like peptidoglycan-associated protein